MYNVELTMQIAVAILCVLQCCLWCMEKCIKFLNKNAYIQTAIHGYDFCKSARTAFFLILRNCLRVVAVNMVADFVLMLSKVMIPGITTTLCYLCIVYGPDSHLKVMCIENFYYDIEYSSPYSKP